MYNIHIKPIEFTINILFTKKITKRDLNIKKVSTIIH